MSLAGKRVVNTRAVHQSRDMDLLLRRWDAEPVPYPCIAIRPPADSGELDAALLGLAAGDYDWLVLTSVNTVVAVAERLAALGVSLPPVKLASVGQATADSIAVMLGLAVTYVPDIFVAEALGEGLPLSGGERILLPQSEIARPVLSEILSERGTEVTAVPAYQTVVGEGGADLGAMLKEGLVDAVTFTSSSTVDNFLRRIRAEGVPAQSLRHICVACIGPKTAETARAQGLTVAVVPLEHTLEGLVSALNDYYERGEVDGSESVADG